MSFENAQQLYEELLRQRDDGAIDESLFLLPVGIVLHRYLGAVANLEY